MKLVNQAEEIISLLSSRFLNVGSVLKIFFSPRRKDHKGKRI